MYSKSLVTSIPYMAQSLPGYIFLDLHFFFESLLNNSNKQEVKDSFQ